MIDPLGDKVYIQPIFESDVSSGGIIVPDMAKERCNQGIVKYVGPDVEELFVGDYVLFSNYDGTLMSVEGEGYIIIVKESGITAKLVDTAEGTEVPGLFFCDEQGHYWTANYEMIFTLVEKAIREEPWYRHIRMKRKRRQIDR